MIFQFEFPPLYSSSFPKVMVIVDVHQNGVHTNLNALYGTNLAWKSFPTKNSDLKREEPNRF